jgi:hypothetical protein
MSVYKRKDKNGKQLAGVRLFASRVIQQYASSVSEKKSP